MMRPSILFALLLGLGFLAAAVGTRTLAGMGHHPDLATCQREGNRIHACGYGQTGKHSFGPMGPLPVRCQCCGSFRGDDDGCFCYYCGKTASEDVFGVSRFEEPATCSGSKRFCMGEFDGDKMRDLMANGRVNEAQDPEAQLALARADVTTTQIEKKRAERNDADAKRNLEVAQASGEPEDVKDAFQHVTKAHDQAETARDSALQAAITFKNRAEVVWEKTNSRLKMAKLRYELSLQRHGQQEKFVDAAIKKELRLAQAGEQAAQIDIHLSRAGVLRESGNDDGTTTAGKQTGGGGGGSSRALNETRAAQAIRAKLDAMENSTEAQAAAAEMQQKAAEGMLRAATEALDPAAIDSAKLEVQAASDRAKRLKQEAENYKGAVTAVLGANSNAKVVHDRMQADVARAAHRATSNCRSYKEANTTLAEQRKRVADLDDGRDRDELKADPTYQRAMQEFEQLESMLTIAKGACKRGTKLYLNITRAALAAANDAAPANVSITGIGSDDDEHKQMSQDALDAVRAVTLARAEQDVARAKLQAAMNSGDPAKMAQAQEELEEKTAAVGVAVTQRRNTAAEVMANFRRLKREEEATKKAQRDEENAKRTDEEMFKKAVALEKGRLQSSEAEMMKESEVDGLVKAVQRRLDAGREVVSKEGTECKQCEAGLTGFEDQEKFLTGNITKLNQENLALNNYISRMNRLVQEREGGGAAAAAAAAAAAKKKARR